ncbi:hypothetical protein [Lacticaseibacillus thailandensis]|uniref:hypothetical protein n=1 Tax=Lacticaseibacillus thailandensis TaxID=381741 RepID=UPI003F6F54B6
MEDISKSLGYAIAPQFTWATIMEKINDEHIKPSDYQDMLDAFERNASLNPQASADFRGVFSNIHLNDSQLGNSTAARARVLSDVVKMINDFDFRDETGRDILGTVYEYLIAEFAANTGKKSRGVLHAP